MLSNLTPEDWEVNVKRTVWKEDGWHRFGLKSWRSVWTSNEGRAVLRAASTSISSRTSDLSFLYAFVDGGVLWKIGMPKDFDRRRAEWDNQCPFPGRIWMAPVPTMTRRRAESLAHLALENSCLDRPRVWCNNCGRQHVEFFVFTGNPGQVWPTIISPILANAAVA
ncbi:MAG: hypothetical protein NXY57DRAFT_1037451 [Lentinula lateritia]|nr:MAG: hypothetical protein NXY57DRAFT_1037451 [Lentinula lateritia]